MKYRMMFNGSLKPDNEPKTIYIIPVSSDADDYRVIYPDIIRKNIVDLLFHNKLIIKQFTVCTDEAFSAIKQELKDTLNKKLEEYSTKINRMVVGGVGLAILGIIDWIFPDPMPLVDEVVLTLGGVALAYAGIKNRQKKIQAYKEKIWLTEKKISELEMTQDPLLSKIFESIQAKEEPDKDEIKMDRIDLESQWLVDYIDVRDMINSHAITSDEVRKIMSGLQDIIPMKKIIKLEKKIERPVAKRKIKRIIDWATKKYGISDGVITVYCEFYKSAKEYLDSKGEEI